MMIIIILAGYSGKKWDAVQESIGIIWHNYNNYSKPLKCIILEDCYCMEETQIELGKQ